MKVIIGRKPCFMQLHDVCKGCTLELHSEMYECMHCWGVPPLLGFPNTGFQTTYTKGEQHNALCTDA